MMNRCLAQLTLILVVGICAGCALESNDPLFDPVYPRYWKIQSISTIPNIPDDQFYEIRFLIDLEATLDCNEASGNYTVTEETLSMNFKHLTYKDCGDFSLASEIETLLASVTRHKSDRTQMTLFTEGPSPVEIHLLPSP